MNYKLFAMDMDGTLLTSDKTISKRNQDRINQALEKGKVLLFSSGRCMQEIEEFLPLFPKMQYIICESGAGIYDIIKKEFIYRKGLEREHVEYILNYAHERDIMIQILADNKSILTQNDYEHTEHFCIENLKKHFSAHAIFTESSYDYCKESNWNAQKICLYHTSPEERVRTREALKHLPVSLAYSERTSLEVSPEGVDKGIAIERVCKHLGISLEETIAIGDGMNDWTILNTVALPLAVANAVPEIQEISSAVVADNDHDGVAEGIEKYLL